MSHTPNQLHEFFPNAEDRLSALIAGNAHAAKLAERYHVVNRDVHRGETNVEPMDDMHLEDLRKERLRLLDEITTMLAKTD